MRPDQEDRFAVRAGTPADAVELAALGQRTFVAAFGAANRPEDLAEYLAATYSPARQRAELEDPTATILLALDDQRLAGFALVRRGHRGHGVSGERPIELQRLYADLPWIGAGVGSFLLRTVIDRAAGWGHDSLWLAVWEHNPRARQLYQRHGFRVVGEQTFVLGRDHQRDLVMERR